MTAFHEEARSRLRFSSESQIAARKKGGLWARGPLPKDLADARPRRGEPDRRQYRDNAERSPVIRSPGHRALFPPSAPLRKPIEENDLLRGQLFRRETPLHPEFHPATVAKTIPIRRETSDWRMGEEVNEVRGYSIYGVEVLTRCKIKCKVAGHRVKDSVAEE